MKKLLLLFAILVSGMAQGQGFVYGDFRSKDSYDPITEIFDFGGEDYTIVDDEFKGRTLDFFWPVMGTVNQLDIGYIGVSLSSVYPGVRFDSWGAWLTNISTIRLANPGKDIFMEATDQVISLNDIQRYTNELGLGISAATNNSWIGTNIRLERFGDDATLHIPFSTN